MLHLTSKWFHRREAGQQPLKVALLDCARLPFKLPEHLSWLFVAAFLILFLVFFLCGCSTGVSNFDKEPDVGKIRKEKIVFPSLRSVDAGPIVPFEPTSNEKKSSPKPPVGTGAITFPASIPAEQRSGRDGYTTHRRPDYQDLGALGEPETASDGVEETPPALEEDWNKRCNQFAGRTDGGSTEIRPAYCNAVRDKITPLLFKESGIPVSGEFRRR